MGPVLIATDLSAPSDHAIEQGVRWAKAVGAPIVVCHVIPDVFRSHPLLPTAGENEMTIANDVTKRAAELVTEQMRRVAGLSPDDEMVVVAMGNPEDEIVRIAERREASLVVVGPAPGGRTTERVVRYAHTPVLVARTTPTSRKLLVATDFTEPSLAALRFAKELVGSAGVEATLLHVMQPPAAVLSSFTSPLGSPIVPPAAGTIERLEELGRDTLQSLASTYGFERTEQVEGDPAVQIVRRAQELGVEMIVMGSRGRTGLARLVLGSTAENVVRTAMCSVVVARE